MFTLIDFILNIMTNISSKLCVFDNLFLFNGKVYKQTDGVAIGNSLGPILHGALGRRIHS